MASFANALGQLGEDYGSAWLKNQQLNMAKQQLSGMLSKWQTEAGAEASRADTQRMLAEQGRFQPLGQTYDPTTKSYNYVLRDVRRGDILRVPVNGMPADSIPALMQQMKDFGVGDGMDSELGNRLVNGAIFKKATGSAATQWGGLRGEWRQVGNQEQFGFVDPVTQKFTPSLINGQPVSRGIGLQWQSVPEFGADGQPTGRTILQPVPMRSGAGGGSAPAVAPSAGNGGGAPPNSTAPQGGGRGAIVKDIPKYSTEAAGSLRDLQSATPLLTALKGSIEDAKLTNAGGIMDGLNTRAEYLKYKAGFPTSQPFYQSAFAMADLYKNIITGLYANGIRRGDLIQAIQRHMPLATDTPKLMYEKALQLEKLNPQIEGAIVQAERQRVKGVPVGDGGAPNYPSALSGYVNMAGKRRVELDNGEVWLVGDGSAEKQNK